MGDSFKSTSERDKASRPPTLKTKNVRSQKIIQLSPSDTRPQDIPEESEPPREHAPTRSHTPGHLSTKSHDRRKKASELALRQRSQSLSQKDGTSSSSSPKVPKAPPSTHSNGSATPRDRDREH